MYQRITITQISALLRRRALEKGGKPTRFSDRPFAFLSRYSTTATGCSLEKLVRVRKIRRGIPELVGDELGVCRLLSLVSVRATAGC